MSKEFEQSLKGGPDELIISHLATKKLYVLMANSPEQSGMVYLSDTLPSKGHPATYLATIKVEEVADFVSFDYIMKRLKNAVINNPNF